MFQPAISTAVATDLLVRFPTSARAGANDIVALVAVENDQSGGSDESVSWFECPNVEWCAPRGRYVIGNRHALKIPQRHRYRRITFRISWLMRWRSSRWLVEEVPPYV